MHRAFTGFALFAVGLLMVVAGSNAGHEQHGSMIIFAFDPTPNPFDHPTNGLAVTHADASSLTEVIGGNNFKREPVWVSG